MNISANTTITTTNDAINNLDLEPIKVKLMDEREGPGWTLQHTDEAEVQYKRFLFLNLEYPNHPHVPSRDMDKFWHFHILDTIKYAEDCQFIFGRFLHHFPYLGLRGDDDAARAKSSWEQSKALYASEFGEAFSTDAEVSSGDDSPEVCGPDPSSCAPVPSCESFMPVKTVLRPRPTRIVAAVA